MQDLNAIITSCASDNRDAQEKLYEHTYRNLGGALSPYIRDASQRDWVFNMGMLKIFKSLKRYQLNTNYLGWARTIIVRTAIDHIRVDKKYNDHLAPVEQDRLENIDDHLENALNALAYEDLLSIVQKLPDRERIVFNLYEIEGYTHKEIEKVTGIKLNTSKWLLANAKKKLRKSIKGVEPLNGTHHGR